MIGLGSVIHSLYLTTDNINDIKSRNRINNIQIEDLKTWYTLSNYNRSLFRQSIKNHRRAYGSDDLYEEIKIIRRLTNEIIRFYDLNKGILDKINKSEFIKDAVQIYDQEQKLAYQELLPIRKRFDNLQKVIENKSWNLGQNHPDVEALFVQETSLKKELELFKEDYKRKYKTWIIETKKHSEISNFSDLIKICTEIQDVLLEFHRPEKLFKNKLPKDFSEIFNAVFQPNLTNSQIFTFINDIEKSDLNIKFKKKIKSFHLIFQLSEAIEDEKNRGKWIESILNYFGESVHYYDQKKKQSGDSKFEKEVQEVLREFK